MQKILNDTKIKYLLVMDKLYEITDINLSDLVLEASETDLLVSDVPAEEVFRLEELREFKISLKNRKGVAEVINFADYVKNRKSQVLKVA